VLEDDLGLGRRVDAVGLDTDQHAAVDLEEQVGVQADDSGLVGLGDVGEDDVDHADQHAVSERVAGVLDDGDDVGAVRGHGDQVSAGAVGEFDGVDAACGPDNVGDVRDGCA